MPRFLPVLLAACALSGCVHTEVTPGSSFAPNDAVVVTGEGEAYGAPDVVHLQLGVEARAADPKVAIEAANNKVAALIDALKSAGIKAEDLQTRDFNINSEYVNPNRPEPMDAPVLEPEAGVAPARTLESAAVTSVPAAPGPKVVGPNTEPAPPPVPSAPHSKVVPRYVYRVSNMLHVTVREIDKVGDVLSRAVEAGANQAWGVSFDIEDPRPLAVKARAEAVRDAREQAAELAQLAGVRLGHVLSVMDEEGAPRPMPGAQMMTKAEMSRVPIEAGQLAVQRRVRVVFAIDRAGSERQ